MAVLGDRFSLGTRTRLLRQSCIDKVEVFPQKDDPLNRVFLEAKQSTCIVVISRPLKPKAIVDVRIHPGRHILSESPGYSAKQDDLYSFTPSQHAVPLVSSPAWDILSTKMHPSLGPTLEAIANIYAGEICDNAQNRHYLSDEPIGPLVLRGANLNRYELLKVAKQGSPRYLNAKAWQASHGGIKPKHAREPRIAFQKGAAVDNWRRLIATIVPANEYCFDTIGYIPFNEATNPYALLAVLNSKLWDFRFSATSTTNHINAYELATIYVPQALIYGREGEDLAQMARMLLELNKKKRSETERFLSWLSSQIAIRSTSQGEGIDGLAGKTTLMNYIGDYQRSMEAVTFHQLWMTLEKNPGKIIRRLNESFRTKVEHEYLLSLANLQPVVCRLAELDKDIDSLVYDMYGLDDDDKALIESR